jgi:hypothetical protein
MLPWTQGCRCAPTAGLKLANAFGVKKTAHAFGVMKTDNAFGVKSRIEIQIPSWYLFQISN